MRKTSILLSVLVLVAMLLAACGAEETGVPETNVPPITAEATATDDMTATEMPTEEATTEATAEPGVPVTGDVDPARVSNQLEFPVLSQDGAQIGDVEDMVLDLDNRSIAYVVVNTGDRIIAVPWESLTLQTGTTSTGMEGAVSTPSGDATAAPEATATGEATVATATTEPAATEPAATADAGAGTGLTEGHAFVLELDQALLDSAPEFDMSVLPEMGQSAGDWDADLRTFWERDGATGGVQGDTNTPAPDRTPVPEGTATGEATLATATSEPAATADAGQAPATGQTQALQGVVLASEVLGSTVTLSPGQGQGQDQGQATAAPDATANPDSTATATTNPGTGQDQGQGVGNISATVEDLIVEIDAGNILYIVLHTTVDDAERWIPVPLGLFQWDASHLGFLLNVNPAVFRDAPFFQEGQFPDTAMEGWDSEFDSFWQNNGAGTGTGTGSGAADATATP